VVSEEKLMIRAVKVILLGTSLLSAAAYGNGTISLATSPAAMGANDSVTWGQLGADGAIIANTFSATSSNLLPITGSFAATATGMTATVGGTWGGASGAFSNGDALIWAFEGGLDTNAGTGPLTISFPAGYGAGAAIQADTLGQFTAQIQLYSGLTSLGTETVTSDANGDAIFIGAVDTMHEVTSAVFSLTAAAAGSASNTLGDFTIDTLSLNDSIDPTPEPQSILLLGGALVFLGYELRRRAAQL
jgi:hypothetical protein